MMIFVVISQRAIPNNNYNLKNLPGHGRIDIIFRCLLSALRPLDNQLGHDIYVYMKGAKPFGWIHLKPTQDYLDQDEISIAAEIKTSWDEYFKTGTFEELLDILPHDHYLLAEDGESLENVNIESQGVIFLGAQKDLTDMELELINAKSVSLGNKPLLASQAITYFRQKLKLIG